jgi:uncharacterized membrane protein
MLEACHLRIERIRSVFSMSDDVGETGENPLSGMSHGRRLWICVAAGVAAGVVCSYAKVGWEFAALTGWCVTSATFLVWVWVQILPLNANETARRATREDDTRAEAGFALLAASTMSLIGVGFGLRHASTLKGWSQASLTILCVLTVAVSWTVVHTVFTLRYAHEYWNDGDGIDFGPDKPAFTDFAYFAFTIGMTYQVSDTNITSRVIRRTVTRQALLSFVFGTTIVAVTINVVASLVQTR